VNRALHLSSAASLRLSKQPLAVVWLAAVLISGAVAARGAEPIVREFRVSCDAAVAEHAPGRLFVFLTTRRHEPRFGPDWFNPEPFFAKDVAVLDAEHPVAIDDAADGFPDTLSHLASGSYRVQALLDCSLDTSDHASAPGNLVGPVVSLEVRDGDGFRCDLRLDRRLSDHPVPEDANAKEVVYRSDLLSSFFKRDISERCAVVLPAGYEQHPERRYPTVYVVPGFGGDQWFSAAQGRRFTEPDDAASEFICVGLSGRCRWGHHVYADSATNGPRGQSLVRELIPIIDGKFRTISQSTARFVTGHSSGGWSSLWLQVNYPDTFGGCWSLSPDPVDFRDFQQVDLYADPPLSLYFNEQGEPRPIARRGKTPALWFPGFARMDDVLGRGGQLRSFEAVFSPSGNDGQPRRLWDRKTGRIDPEVARAWQAYDIRLLLERNWERLEPKLRGKLHITTGELDTFYLDGAVRRLSEMLQKQGSDARIEIVPGRDHGSVVTDELFLNIHREMTASFLQHHPK
jgi:hypothetical protein